MLENVNSNLLENCNISTMLENMTFKIDFFF